MKKLWFPSLAVALGLLSTTAWGQYPGGTNNFGPSSYPVPTQSILQNLPQVPSLYQPQGQAQEQPYQLVGAQEQLDSGFGQPVIPGVPPTPPPQVPVPPPAANANPGYGTAPMAPPPAAPMAGNVGPGAAMVAPTPGYGYPQTVAPNCSTCGPAPVSQAYGCSPNAGYTVAPLQALSIRSMPAQAKSWFFGAGLLLINRIDNKNIPLSHEDASYAPDILGTRDARFGTAAGFEATIGRYFNCGRNAIAATYWGIFPEDEQALRARSMAGDYRSRIPFTYMTMAGTPAAPTTPYAVYDWFDNAYTHTLQRSAEYHNVEVNLLGFAVGGAARNFNRSTAGSLFSGTRARGRCGYCDGSGCGNCAASCGTSCGPSRFATGPCGLTAPACGSRLNVSWLAGFRYFRFTDNLLYAASLDDTVINRAADDLYYEVNTTNDLVGFQLGGRLDYCVGKRINLYGNTKVGVYNNRSTLYTRIGTDFDNAYLNDTRTPANPNNNQDYLFDVTKNQVAFLSEIGAGMGVRVSCKWTATVGYRAVIASGVATSTDNVLNAFANYTDVRDFDNYGTLVLHGINVGGIYNY